jgi:spore coat protein H
VDEIAAAIRPAVKEESPTKLGLLEDAVAGRPVDAGAGMNGRGSGGRGGGRQAATPIKAFAKARAQGVVNQLAGKSLAQTLSDARGGGFGNRGGRGRGGVQDNPDPGSGALRAFMDACDANKDGQITPDEFARGFTKWFQTWNTDKTGLLTTEQLRLGINRTFSLLQ